MVEGVGRGEGETTVQSGEGDVLLYHLFDFDFGDMWVLYLKRCTRKSRVWARFGQTEAGFLSSVRFERLPNPLLWIRLGNRGRRAPCAGPFGSFVPNFCFGKCKTLVNGRRIEKVF